MSCGFTEMHCPNRVAGGFSPPAPTEIIEPGPFDYRGLASGAIRLHPLEKRPMAGCDRRRAGRTGPRAAGAGGDTGLRLVRCRRREDLLSADYGSLIRDTVVPFCAFMSPLRLQREPLNILEKSRAAREGPVTQLEAMTRDDTFVPVDANKNVGSYKLVRHRAISPAVSAAAGRYSRG